MMKEVKLPSGAVLKITPSPFKEANALLKALSRDLKGVQLNSKYEVGEMIKNALCAAVSSTEVESCIWACFARCLYNGGAGDLKITEDTFEPIKARQDYIAACIEVGTVNVGPFLNGLSAGFQGFLKKLLELLK